MKTVVITGAASGIGRELVLIYLANQYRVAAVDMNQTGLELLSKCAEDFPDSELIVQCLDITDEQKFHDFAAQLNQQVSSIDIVINNAGLTHLGYFSDTDAKAFNHVLNVNFFGVVNGARAFMPYLKHSKGCLVNVSSLFGLIGVPAQAAYCASKFAVRGFSEALRVEAANDGVQVTVVHPGGVKTNIAKNALYGPQENFSAVVESIEKNALKLSPEGAAAIIFKGVDARKARIIVGRDAGLIDRIQRFFPVLYPKVIRALGGKPFMEAKG
jgi:short-subunit dehydrogenase